MKLTYWDLDWVHNRMNWYDIKYQEIYNELFDHITTAIEEKKQTGDTRSLETIFHDVVDTDFGGYLGIEKVAQSHESGYKSKVKKMMWSNFRHYINFRSFAFTLALMLISFTFPLNKMTFVILGSMILVATIFPSVFSYIKLRPIKRSQDKTSLVYSHIITQSNLPAVALNSILWLPKIPYIFMGEEFSYKIYNIPPSALALWLALVIIFDLSCIRLCKQEIKQFSIIKN